MYVWKKTFEPTIHCISVISSVHKSCVLFNLCFLFFLWLGTALTDMNCCSHQFLLMWVFMFLNYSNTELLHNIAKCVSLYVHQTYYITDTNNDCLCCNTVELSIPYICNSIKIKFSWRRFVQVPWNIPKNKMYTVHSLNFNLIVKFLAHYDIKHNTSPYFKGARHLKMLNYTMTV